MQLLQVKLLHCCARFTTSLASARLWLHQHHTLSVLMAGAHGAR